MTKPNGTCYTCGNPNAVIILRTTECPNPFCRWFSPALIAERLTAHLSGKWGGGVKDLHHKHFPHRSGLGAGKDIFTWMNDVFPKRVEAEARQVRLVISSFYGKYNPEDIAILDCLVFIPEEGPTGPGHEWSVGELLDYYSPVWIDTAGGKANVSKATLAAVAWRVTPGVGYYIENSYEVTTEKITNPDTIGKAFWFLGELILHGKRFAKKPVPTSP